MMRIALASILVGVVACASPPAAAPAPAPSAAPSHAWKAAAGCGDMNLYIPDRTDTAFIVINVKRKMLGLEASGDTKTIELTGAEPPLHVSSYPRPGGGEQYCNDVVSGNAPRATESWRPVSGKLTFTLGSFRNEHDFEVSLKLEGVRVKHPDGTIEAIPDATYPNLHLGWLPG